MDIPPSDVNNIFTFTDNGYTEPLFSSSREITMSDIKASIISMSLEYDYLKSCHEYIVGYNLYDMQVIRTDCIYGGIRDLQSFLHVVSHTLDLHVYIREGFVGQLDIFKIVRAFNTGSVEIDGPIRGWAKEYTDLYNYIKSTSSFSEDLQLHLNIFYAQQENLYTVVRGYSTGNIVDILNTVRIQHEAVLDIPAYLKSTIQQGKDLSTIVYKIFQRKQQDINKILHGWQEVQLQKLIVAFHTLDLSIVLRSTYFNDLNGALLAILPVDISAALFSWTINDLQVCIVDSKYDGDLNFTLFGIPSENLNFKIYVKRGLNIIKDLSARLTNMYVFDLGGILQTIQYTNLNVFLNSTRLYSDLLVKIYPKIVHIKNHINISFLECFDLAAIVNFPCFSSMYKDLVASLVVKPSKDLKFYVYGYDYSNILDLACSINSSAYLSVNTINISYFHDPQLVSTTIVRYENKQPYYTFNTINLWTNTLTRDTLNLMVSVFGEPLVRDLPVFIRACSNLHYKNNNLRERFITLKLKNNIEAFRHYVEVTFNSYARQYTYFSGEHRAYPTFKNEHWVIRVEGYELLPIGRGFEKTKVKKKYIFSLKNYNSIDEAIRDMIDRVTSMKYYDLGLFINSISDKRLDLGAHLKPKRVYKSNRVLGVALRSGQFMLAELPITIRSAVNTAFFNLAGSILPVEGSTSLGVVDFEFLGVGDVVPTPSDANFIFDLEDI